MTAYWFLAFPVAVNAAALVLIAGALIGKEGIPKSFVDLPKRIPGNALGGEQAAWDVLYRDVDPRDLEYRFNMPKPWGLSALTEPTAAYAVVSYEIPEATEYESVSAA